MSTISGTTSSTTSTTTDTHSVGRRLAIGLAATALALGGSLVGAAPAFAVSQASAESQLGSAGITWTSSGGCTTQGNPTCTSFSGLRQPTIDGATTLTSASGCSLLITGGTEVGHAGGTYSHGAGYKLDFSRSSCLTGWITDTYHYIGQRGDGAALYEAASGNVYADEGNHWDVTFYSCGC